MMTKAVVEVMFREAFECLCSVYILQQQEGKDMQSAQRFPVITRNTQTYNEKHK